MLISFGALGAVLCVVTHASPVVSRHTGRQGRGLELKG